MFEVCAKACEFLEEIAEHESGLEIPILPDIYGYTCLDYCLPDANITDHIDYDIFVRLQEDELQI